MLIPHGYKWVWLKIQELGQTAGLVPFTKASWVHFFEPRPFGCVYMGASFLRVPFLVGFQGTPKGSRFLGSPRKKKKNTDLDMRN